MATFKLSIKRGQSYKDVVRSSGTTIAGSDAIEVNIDTTNLTRGEAVKALDEIQRQILSKGFPQ